MAAIVNTSVSKKSLQIGMLEIIAFVTGFALMVFELAGARILAPGIGSSTYVWTSVIGVIIAALSLGYWVGGRAADSRGYMIDVARLTLVASLTVVLTLLQYESVVRWVAESFTDPRMQGVMASLILFAPTSFVLGTISPYLAKLKVRSLSTTGRSIASLSALNSIGGIVGTFVAGFILFGYIGSHETLAIVALTLMSISWLAVPSVERRLRAAVSAVMIVIVLMPPLSTGAIAIDTPGAHYVVYETDDMRLLATGPNAAQSGISLADHNELAFWYTQELANITEQASTRKDILILGGGAFTLPQYLAEKYPDSSIDVVEIDPELVAIARQYFNYDDPKNVTIITTDARTYVNQTDKQYDIVMIDVYGDTHVPFTMLTREYGHRIAKITKPGGLVVANLLAQTKGECRTLLLALEAPYRSHFANTEYKIQHPDNSRSNMVTVYSNRPIEWSGGVSLDLPKVAPYTDNYAPAERLQHACRRSD